MPTLMFGMEFSKNVTFTNSRQLILLDSNGSEFRRVRPEMFSTYFKGETKHIGDDSRFNFQKAYVTKVRDRKVRLFVTVQCDKTIKSFKVMYDYNNIKKPDIKRLITIKKYGNAGEKPWVTYLKEPSQKLFKREIESFGGILSDVFEKSE